MWARSWTWDNLSSLWDYTFDVATWQLVSQGPAAKRPDGSITPAHGHDFPAIHPGYVGKKARYVYVVANAYGGQLKGPDAKDKYVGASFVPGSQVPGAFGFANSLEKYDLNTGEVKEHYLGKTSSDMVFVPKEGGAKEDDGYLLSVVYNDDRHTSSVLILDAESMDTVCEIELPVHVTTTFHGCWVPRL
jgi:carotenoid cleavage dioxygenase-like enzyme